MIKIEREDVSPPFDVYVLWIGKRRIGTIIELMIPVVVIVLFLARWPNG